MDFKGLDFAALIKQVEDHLRNGGEFVLESAGGKYSACAGPKGTYAIIGEDGNGILFNQGAVGIGQLLNLMDQQTGSGGRLSEWRAVEGG